MTGEAGVRRVDALGRRCPLPVIDLARAITEVEVGQVVVLVSDDPAAAADVPAWCRMKGHEYVGESSEAVGRGYRVRRTS